MDDKTFHYEDEVAGHMQEFIVKESGRAFTIEVPGIPPQDATDTTPAVEGTPTRNWSFPKEALAKVFTHAREDLPALCDFIQAAWSFSRVPDTLPETIVKPTEEQLKLTAVCKKFSQSLLDTLGVHSYAQFRELSMAVDHDTTTGAVRAAEAAAAKEAKAAERKAARDAKNADKIAEREKVKAEKKAAKEAERAAKKAAKEAERAEKKAKQKAEIEAARIASVAAKNAELAANGGKTAAQAEKAERKGKFTGKTKEKALSKEEKAELARVAAEDKAKKDAMLAEKAKMDAEFDAAGSKEEFVTNGDEPKGGDDAVADAILNDDTQQG